MKLYARRNGISDKLGVLERLATAVSRDSAVPLPADGRVSIPASPIESLGESAGEKGTEADSWSSNGKRRDGRKGGKSSETDTRDVYKEPRRFRVA